MKARVKATGEIFEIASYATIPMECCDSFGEPLRFTFDDVEILSEGNNLNESDIPDYWTRLEHQAVITAMQGILGNQTYTKSLLETSTSAKDARNIIVDASYHLAHALVQKLKEKEERK